MTENCIAIVDPFSAGALLAEALVARGARCIAVISSNDLPVSMRSRFDADLFSDIIQHSRSLDKTSTELEQRGTTHVIAGCESGVELAEQLSHDLGLAGNGAAQRDARRDKFLMAETIRAQGLRAARQFCAPDADQIVARVREEFEFPIILKPTRSTASDLVFRCDSIDTVADGAQQILSRSNILGRKNDSVLVQEFLDGVEYVVDTVTLDDTRKTTAFWQYQRPELRGRFIAYDAMTLLPYQGERQSALQTYAYKVLDALSLQYGPAHCELMWVDDEPVLIEVGARLSGGINAVLSGICGGLAQLDETVDLILSPEQFKNSMLEEPLLEKRAAHVFLISPAEGRLQAINGLDKISGLPTLRSMSVSAKPGTELKQVAGTVVLVDEDIGAIERDIRAIRTIERAGLFKVYSPG